MDEPTEQEIQEALTYYVGFPDASWNKPYIVLTAAYRSIRSRLQEREAEIQSHHEETEQVCGYKKLIDTRAELEAARARTQNLLDEFDMWQVGVGTLKRVVKAREALRGE